MPARVSSQPIRYERQPPERTCSKSMAHRARDRRRASSVSCVSWRRRVIDRWCDGCTRRRSARKVGDVTSTRAQRTVARLETAPPLAALQSGPMPARVANVLVGTASWTERTLLESGAFYPPGVTAPADRLRYYARHFPVVEVDATFYALPAESMARAWVTRVPVDFVFGVKAFAALTQHPFVPARLPPDLRTAIGATLARRPRVYPRELPAEVDAEMWRRFASALTP